MANPHSNPSQISLFFIIISYLISIISGQPISLGLRNDSNAMKLASNDYGNIYHEIPTGVLYPSTISDVIDLVRSSNNRSIPFTVAARGNGHSVRGQAMARGGVVVDMTGFMSKNHVRIIYGNNNSSSSSSSGFYADVDGGMMWIDVLRETLAMGLSPVSWTDYLYLTVGGTLSNVGISGQSFLHGPQINNVVQLDVITGKGEFVTCSRSKNPDLFFAVLGGLGQFGIITRARIVIHIAPTRVKWVRLVYSDFSMFSRDQEWLISISGINAPSFVEGFIVTNANDTNEWRSSFSSPSNQSDIVSLLKKQGLIYAIELVKYYDNSTANTIDKEFEKLLKELNFIPKLIFSTDVPIFDFLARVPNLDNPNGLNAHPWLNLFIPKSRISDFNDGVLAGILPKINQTSSLFIFYPLNKNKWDDRMSAVTPDEPTFYALSLLHTSPANGYQIIDNFNTQILEFCKKAGINVKQYLPYIKSKADWIKHYGSKWNTIRRKKSLFDPKFILSPGQRIFNSA